MIQREAEEERKRREEELAREEAEEIEAKREEGLRKKRGILIADWISEICTNKSPNLPSLLWHNDNKHPVVYSLVQPTTKWNFWLVQ